MTDETNLNYTNVKGEEIRKWLSPKVSPEAEGTDSDSEHKTRQPVEN